MDRFILFVSFITVFGGCTTNTAEFYSGPRYLYVVNDSGADTAYVSFSNYPGLKQLEVPFAISLTGEMPGEDMEYKLEVVDSLTTAKSGDYALPERLIFRKDRITDTVNITIKNERAELFRQSFKVTFRIVANEYFQPGYTDRRDIKITFNDIKGKPDWWKDDLEKMILGTYSDKKMEHFILATRVNSLEGVELSEVRRLTLIFKKYLRENNIMEEDNVTPMVDGVPCY